MAGSTPSEHALIGSDLGVHCPPIYTISSVNFLLLGQPLDLIASWLSTHGSNIGFVVNLVSNLCKL